MSLLLAYTLDSSENPALAPDGGTESPRATVQLNSKSSRVKPRCPVKVQSLSLLFEFICKFPGVMVAPSGNVSGSLFELSSALTLHLALLRFVFQLSISYLKCTEDVATLEFNLFLK